MSDDGYTPLIDREREPKSRANPKLTESARERLAMIITDLANTSTLDEATTRISKDIATSELLGDADDANLTDEFERAHSLFRNADTIPILTFIEYVFDDIYDTTQIKPDDGGFLDGARVELNEYSVDEVHKAVSDIQDVLITEGLLWEIEHNEGQYIQFNRIESEAFGKIDSKVQGLAESEPWDEALKGYNDAFDRYLKGDFDEQIPRKLYYSIEEVLKIICVDKEGWTDNRELTHAKYLEMLKEHGVYDAHGVTADELGNLLKSLERMVAKVGGERKQRHAYHDRAYSTLLIHQVGAYLYFLINRYEEYSS